MKRLMLLAAILAVFLVAATPALAQVQSQYSPEGPHTPGEEVAARGVINKLTGATTWQYGSHTLQDSDTGNIAYALTSDSVDLDAYDGQKVTVYGTVVPGYENGMVEGGPTLLDVYHVGPLGGMDGTPFPPIEDSAIEDSGSPEYADGSGTGNGSMDEATSEEATRESGSARSAASSADGAPPREQAYKCCRPPTVSHSCSPQLAYSWLPASSG